MVTPDPISEWSQDEISSWINGLDIGLDRYKESLKYLTGDQLLTAKYTDLYQYGIDKGSVQTYFPDFFYQLRIVRGPYRCSGDFFLLNRKKLDIKKPFSMQFYYWTIQFGKYDLDH